MADHPIQGLMKTAMESIKEMVDVNTIVGDAVETPDGTVIIPISRVAFGFAAGGGGGEFDEPDFDDEGNEGETTPAFGGGSGAGVSVKPVGFLICSANTGVRFIPVEGHILYDRILDMVPQVLDRLQQMMKGCGKKEASNGSDNMDALAKTVETQAVD